MKTFFRLQIKIVFHQLISESRENCYRWAHDVFTSADAKPMLFFVDFERLCVCAFYKLFITRALYPSLVTASKRRKNEIQEGRQAMEKNSKQFTHRQLLDLDLLLQRFPNNVCVFEFLAI